MGTGRVYHPAGNAPGRGARASNRYKGVAQPLSKGTWVFIGFIGVAVVALLTQLPGTPVWRLLNPTLTVTVAGSGESAEPTELKIVSVLARDAIDAILDPSFVSGDAAAAQMAPTSRIIGLSINGDHRAYSTAQLSSREVVNDTVGGVPVVVTW